MCIICVSSLAAGCGVLPFCGDKINDVCSRTFFLTTTAEVPELCGSMPSEWVFCVVVFFFRSRCRRRMIYSRTDVTGVYPCDVSPWRAHHYVQLARTTILFMLRVVKCDILLVQPPNLNGHLASSTLQ